MTITKNGTPDFAPVFFTNSSGSTSWSGLHIDAITPELVEDIHDFCYGEGGRQGWNAAHRKEVDIRFSMLFHPDFLEGLPHLWWNTYYELGREAYKNNSRSCSE